MPYPTLGQNKETRIAPIPGSRMATAPNGQVTAQAETSALGYQITCVHGMVTPTDLAAMKAFYAANARLSFSWTAAETGTTYTVVFRDNGIDWAPRGRGSDGVKRFWLQTFLRTAT